MRTMIVWTLSILLGFEPALLAAGTKINPNSDIKAFLENSQITLRTMTIKELYSRTSKDLPDSVRADFETFISKQGNALVPKFDVNKVTGPNGEELYQIQAVQDGKAVSMTFVLGKEVFMKLNGTNFTWTEMSDVRQVMAKAGLEPKEIQENFPNRKPASNRTLSADQILRLNKDQKKIYFKQFRNLLDSMDAVEKALGHKKTSSHNSPRFPDKAQLLVQFWLGPLATADESSPEVEKCKKSFLKDSGDNRVTSGNGTDVRAPFSDLVCNPTSPKAKENYEDWRKKAEISMKNVEIGCAKKQVEDDTLEARCEKYKREEAPLLQWRCKDPEFNAAHSYCQDPLFKSQTPDPVPEKAALEVSTASVSDSVPLPEAMQSCSVEPRDNHLSFKEQNECASAESNGLIKTRPWICFEANRVSSSRMVYECECQNGGTIIGKMKCSGGAKSNSLAEKVTPGLKKAKAINWLPIAVIGGFIGLSYWAIHSVNKAKRKRETPQYNPPPIDVPEVTPVTTILPPAAIEVNKKKEKGSH